MKNIFKSKITLSSLIPVNNLKFLILNHKITSIPSNKSMVSFTRLKSSKKIIKIFLKQSYVLFTWLLYSNNLKGSFFVKPVKQHRLTLLKTPMAHKTFSQEQFKWLKYNTLVSYKSLINTPLTKLNMGLKFVLNFRLFLRKTTLSTNLFFLKKTTFIFFFFESGFFKLTNLK